MWRSDCEKEEKKSFDRWKCTEKWLFDYEENYGNDFVKIKRKTKIHQPPHRNTHNSETKDYATAWERSYPTNDSNKHQATVNKQRRVKDFERGNTHRFKGNLGRQREPHIINRGGIPSFERPFNNTNNIYRSGGTTYIGRGARNYFLGGGKPNQGQKYRNVADYSNNK